MDVHRVGRPSCGWRWVSVLLVLVSFYAEPEMQIREVTQDLALVGDRGAGCQSVPIRTEYRHQNLYQNLYQHPLPDWSAA